MSIASFSVNTIGVLAAAVASFIIGMFWYSPKVFGETWAKLSKIKMNGKKKGMAKMMILNLIGTIITAYIFAIIVRMATAVTILDGVQLGIIIWLGFFISTTLLNSVLWEGKSWKLYALNGAYWLVNLIVMGIILSLWG